MSSDNSHIGGLQLEAAWSRERLRAALPLPKQDDNKYSRGFLTVVAGSKRYPGAACLASAAGTRMGAGYTEVVTHARAASLVLAAHPSLVVRDVADWNVAESRCAQDKPNQAVCMGPGFAAGSKKLKSLVVDVLFEAKCPVLVDGGALAVLGSRKALEALAHRRDAGLATVITPHGGEADRMKLSLGVRASSPEKTSAVLALATGAVAVVKGPDTFVSDGKRVYAMREGTPALAKAGTGDVLAGMIAALLAQGLDPVEAAILGSTLHARAGKAAAARLTDICVTAEDVIEAIPEAVSSIVGGE